MPAIDAAHAAPIPEAPPPAAKTPLVRRLLPLIVIVALMGAFFGLGLHRYVSFDALRENREALIGFRDANYALAALIFVGAYALFTALSLPIGLVLTLTGGFVFGPVFGTLFVVTGATLGATGIFLAAKTALGDALKQKAGPFVTKLEAGFRENALSYLLVLRLVPLFPFWLVNLVPAFLGVSLTTYVIGTFVGIVPGSFVYASVGNGLGAVFDAGGTPDLGIIFKPEVLLPIVGLAVLSLIPIAYKRIKARKA